MEMCVYNNSALSACVLHVPGDVHWLCVTENINIYLRLIHQ